MFRLGVNTKGEPVAHLIESVCRSHKLVTRSTYAAELLGAAAGCDDALPVLVTLHEFVKGPLPARQAVLLRENGGYCYKLLLTIDAMSVYHSIVALHLKAPSEKSLLSHLCWLRELFLTGIVSQVRWCDTRDMSCDGHTKGQIERGGLLASMRGDYGFKHALVHSHALA